MAKKKIDIKIIIPILFVALVIFFVSRQPTDKTTDMEGGTSLEDVTFPLSGGWDISEEVKKEGLEQYLVEEPDFDYSHPLVYTAAQEIKSRTTNPERAIKQTAKHVALNTQYSSAVSIGYCYTEKASTVAESGVGDCVSMSRLVTSILRAQGIPARTVGGCLSLERRCDILFSTVPYLEPQVVELEEGDFKKRGFLHEWVEAWEPDRGWFVIEATAGRIYPKDCVSYLQFAYDTDNKNRCVITDKTFWNECKIY